MHRQFLGTYHHNASLGVKRLFQNKKRGFTLIEVVLYVAIAGMVVFALGFLVKESGETRLRQRVMAEVEQQGLLISDHISQAIRNAASITTPSAGNTTSSLTLAYADVLKNPTVFDVSADAVQITEGAESPIPLTNTRVLVTDFSFHNLSLASTPGSVQFSFTLNYVLSSDDATRFQYSRTFYGAASLR